MELTQSDERARRICSLALAFMNASAPLASSEIARDYYPGLAKKSFQRAFARDREALLACGIRVVEKDSGPSESEWTADSQVSFATGPELTPGEAAALAVACRPLLADPGFPMADELRFALAKLGRAFAEPVAVSNKPAKPSPAVKTLRSCLLAQHAARVTYTDAKGRDSERVLAPYGFFALRDALYLVAARLDCSEDAGRSQEPHTYRVDRIREAVELGDRPYSIPTDFCVEDFRRLPFQLGEKVCSGVFESAAGERAAYGVSSITDAASWAVAEGLRPIEPPELVDAWKRVLEGVLEDGE